MIRQQTTPEQARAARLEEARLAVDVTLHRLAGLLVLVEPLRVTSQPSYTVMSPEALTAINEQDARDRRQRRWAVAAGFPQPTGPTRAPLQNLAASEVLMTTHLGLHGWVRRILSDQARAGLCLLPRVVPAPHPAPLARQLADLTWTLRRVGVVNAIGSDARGWVTAADRIVNGERRIGLPDPCPWCHRRSLVHYADQHIVVCERPHLEHGGRPTCVCDRDTCPCRGTATRYEHTWSSQTGVTDPRSWDTLKRLLDARARDRAVSS